MISDTLNIEPGFGQTATFARKLNVPLRLKVLTNGCYVPVRNLEEERKKANYPHTATKETLWGTLYHPDQLSVFVKNKNSQ